MLHTSNTIVYVTPISADLVTADNKTLSTVSLGDARAEVMAHLRLNSFNSSFSVDMLRYEIRAHHPLGRVKKQDNEMYLALYAYINWGPPRYFIMADFDNVVLYCTVWDGELMFTENILKASTFMSEEQCNDFMKKYEVKQDCSLLPMLINGRNPLSHEKFTYYHEYINCIEWEKLNTFILPN